MPSERQQNYFRPKRTLKYSGENHPCDKKDPLRSQRGGLSCSLAFNGNSAFCSLDYVQSQNCSSLSSFALEPIKQSLRFVGVRLPLSKLLSALKLEMVGVVLDLLHAHRVSPKGLCPSQLNLFAIRTSNF